jgi:hypothetical protein
VCVHLTPEDLYTVAIDNRNSDGICGEGTGEMSKLLYPEAERFAFPRYAQAEASLRNVD